MEWTQFVILIVTMSGLFLWNHNEIHSNQKENRELIQAIHDEIKDFHRRLCALEERNKEKKC